MLLVDPPRGRWCKAILRELLPSTRLGSVAVRAVIDRHHAISPYGHINELCDLVLLSKRKAGQIFSEFRHRGLQNDACRMALRIPEAARSLCGKGCTIIIRDNQTWVRTRWGRRTDELDLYLDWRPYFFISVASAGPILVACPIINAATISESICLPFTRSRNSENH